MKKSFAIFLFLIFLVQAASAVCAEAAVKENNIIEIHVSPEGRDSNSGTADSPVATMEKARSLVRAVRADQKKTVNVIFHEGTYRISRTVNFDEKDSGTKDAPITYKAAEGERVIFKGSKVLDTKLFKSVTDPAILKRLPENARDYVGVLDLREQGINQIGAVPYGRGGVNAVTGYHQLYFDDRPQTLARFPNYGYTTIKKLTNAASKTFQMAEYNITRWGLAKNVRAGGYFENDYNYDRKVVSSINAEERTLQISSGSAISGANRRFYVYNLLEEIDMPGEWYIDPETFLLYYYPQNRISDETLEISTLGTVAFKLDNIHYVNFEGLEFAQMRYDVFQLPSCTNITFDNCLFRDIEGSAIRDYADLYRESQKTPNSYNIAIKNSIFKNIGFAAITLRGGDEKTLEESGDIIENCYFTGVGTEIISYVPAVNFNGVGITVKNCTIHNAGAHLLQGGGSLHKFQNNELFDACKEVHDAGAIYAGRNLYQRGVEVSGNYFHHIKSIDKNIGEIACGVYMDDKLSEWYIHHNIFYGISRGVFMNTGNDAEIHDNIFVENDVGVRISGAKKQWQNLYPATDEWVKQYPVYLEKFPKIANINEPVGMAHDNHVTDNLFVNSQKEIPLYEGDEKLANEDENNFMVNEFEDFLDEEKGNYAIKKDAEILNTHPGLGEISLDDIGVSEDVIKKVNELLGRDIVRLFPRNGAENVNSAKAEFMWTKSDIYDKYRIIIADDPEMKNIVEDEIVSYNYYSTNRLEPGIKTYYWTVTGIDISKENFEDLPSVGKPYKLMTSKYENSDKIILEETIKKANDLLGTLSEGDEAGQCAEGTISDFKSVIERAETVNKEKLASQSEVDIMAEELSLAITKVTASRKAGYLSIEDYLNNQEGWFAGDKVYEEGIMHVEGVEYGYYEASELPGYQLLKFKMKADFTGEWTGFGLRQQTPGMAYSNGGVGYMIIIKENNIEFQRYNNGGGMIKNIENNCIKPGEWHEYEVGAIDVLGGIRVILRVDGKTILNELDTDGVITEPGHFQVYNRLSSAEHYSNYFELAVSDDEITEFDNSILTGKLSPEEPELVDGFDKLFPAGSEPEIINGTVRRGENSVSFKAESGAEYGTLSCGGMEGNEVFNMRIKFNISEGWQGIGMRADECEGLPWTIENYLFIVKKDVVELQRVSGEGITFLALYPNEYIKDGEFTELTFGAYPTDKGMRIMVYSGENKIIDYTDVYSKHASLRVNFYDRNGKGMEFER